MATHPEELHRNLGGRHGPGWLYGPNQFHHPGRAVQERLYGTNPTQLRRGGCGENDSVVGAPDDPVARERERILHRVPIPTPSSTLGTAPTVRVATVEINDEDDIWKTQIPEEGYSVTDSWEPGHVRGVRSDMDQHEETKHRIMLQGREREGDGPKLEWDARRAMHGPFAGGQEPIRNPAKRCVCDRVRTLWLDEGTRTLPDSVYSYAIRPKNMIRLSRDMVERGIAHPPLDPLPVVRGSRYGELCVCSVVGPSIYLAFAQSLGVGTNAIHISDVPTPPTFLAKLRRNFIRRVESNALDAVNREKKKKWVRKHATERWINASRDQLWSEMESGVDERALFRIHGRELDLAGEVMLDRAVAVSGSEQDHARQYRRRAMT